MKFPKDPNAIPTTATAGASGAGKNEDVEMNGQWRKPKNINKKKAGKKGSQAPLWVIQDFTKNTDNFMIRDARIRLSLIRID